MIKNVEFSQEEANALIGVLDLAVKAGGLNAAESALYFHKKLSDAFAKPEVEEKE